MSIGLEIASEYMSLVEIKKNRKHQEQISNYGIIDLPEGLIIPTLNKLNISDTNLFNECLLNLFRKCNINPKGKKIGVALPDLTFQIGFLSFETLLKKHKETDEIIRWRLKDKIPIDSYDMVVRFQDLGKNNSQSHLTIIAVAHKDILLQYEQSLWNIGLKVELIDTTFFCLYNLLIRYFENVIPSDSIFSLISYKDKVISIMVFESGCAVFFRCKRVESESLEEEIIIYNKEIESSIAFYEERWNERISHLCIIGIGIISSFDESVANKNIIPYSSIKDKLPLFANLTEDVRLLSAIGVARRYAEDKI